MFSPRFRPRRILVETVVCFVVLTMLLLVMFNQAVYELAAGDTPGMFDIKHYFVPMSFVLDTALASGEVPHWNPLTFCGAPFAANPQSATFYPPNFLRSLITPGQSPLNAYYGLILLAALQTVVAGLGVYWLARSHGLSYAPALAAAATFIFSIAYTVRLAELHFVPALVWIPFALLAFRSFLRAPNRSRRLFFAVGCGMMFGWSFLSGFLQLQVHVALFFLCYWLLDRLLLTRWENYGSHTPIAARVGADVMYGSCIILIACSIAAAMIVPGAEFAQHTFRSGDGQASLPHANLTWSAIRAGLFYTDDSDYPSAFSATMISAYVLAVIGLLGTRRREAFAYTLLFLAIFDCSLGPPLPLATLVETVSPVQLAQPQRAFVIACLPLGMAVGFGIHALGDRTGTVRSHAIKSVVIAAVCAGLLMQTNLLFSNVVTILITSLGVIAVVGVWLPLKRFVLPLACGVLLLEAVHINHKYLPRLIDRSGPINIGYISQNTNPSLWNTNFRVCDPAPNRHLYRLRPAINGYDPLYLSSVWRVLAPSHYNSNYARILQAYDVVLDNPYPYSFVKRPFWLVRQYVRGPLPESRPAFRPTTTAFVETGDTLSIPEVSVVDVALGATSGYGKIDLELTEIVNTGPRSGGPYWNVAIPDHDYKHAVLRIKFETECPGALRFWIKAPDLIDGTLPAYLATVDDEQLGTIELDVPLPDTGPATISMIWEPTAGGCIPKMSEALLFVDGDDEDDLIRIVERTFNAVRVEVGELTEARLLAFIDADYPGWLVRVDGERRPLLRVNSAFKGVELGPGAHTVEFRYQSKMVRIGMAISGGCAVIILCGLVLTIARRRNRRVS